MATYGLYGIEGLYNYGCEAIVRGIERIIHSLHPDDEIIYYSRNYLQDKKIIRDIRVKVVNCKKRENYLRKAVNKLLRLANARCRIPLDNYQMMMDECDVLVSIGGDIYTIPKYRRDKKNAEIYNKLVYWGNKVLRANKPLMIAGASIGPFGNNLKIKQYYFDHLKEVTKIVCREQNSIAYLNENGVNKNTVLLPDPAFALARGVSKYDRKGYIVVNFSSLSFVSSIGSSDSGVEKCVHIVLKLLSETGQKIVMLPHVISPYSVKDNDKAFLKKVYDAIPEDRHKDIIPINTDTLSFYAAKDILEKASIVIAARMHCAVNAISEGIPTLFLSYSSKSIGMSEFVYEHDEYVVNCEESEDLIVKQILSLYENRDNVHIQIKKRMEGITEQIKNYDTVFCM